MNTKLKTLVYFFCFLGACLIYYIVEQQGQPQNPTKSNTLVKAKFEAADSLKETGEKRLEEPE